MPYWYFQLLCDGTDGDHVDNRTGEMFSWLNDPDTGGAVRAWSLPAAVRRMYETHPLSYFEYKASGADYVIYFCRYRDNDRLVRVQQKKRRAGAFGSVPAHEWEPKAPQGESVTFRPAVAGL